jgi:hypothetical protein
VKGREAGPAKVALAEVLSAVPVRNQAVREERKSGEESVLFVPLRKRWFMGPPLSWLLPFSSERGVGLDRLGREVWEACDGKRTAERLIEEFAARHHVTFHEARVSVLAFLRELTRHGAIVMVKPGSEGAGV